MLNFKLTSKTIFGGILIALGKLGESGALPASWTVALHALSQIVEGLGYFVALWGIWHGQQKVKATIQMGVDPDTGNVTNPPVVRR